MSFATSDALARDWARRLEQVEAARSGLSLARARRKLASRLGVLPGTLENLRRDRLKGVRERLYQALRQAVIDELSRELAAVSHEMDCLVRAGLQPADPALAEVSASLAQARGALMAAVEGKRGGHC